MATQRIALDEGIADSALHWYRRVPVVVWPLALYILGVAVEVLWSYRLAAHHFVYPLDDTYIHMDIAKNFALHGVWGVTRFGFTSSSSSLLFDLLIAVVYLVTGPRVWVPLAISVAGGAFAIVAADRMLPGDKKLRLAGLFALVVFTPLFCTAAIGMEHTLHILFTLAFAWRAARVIHEEREWDWLLLALAALVVMARYEGLFLVAAAVLLLLIRRNLRLAAASVAAAWAPITVFGIISIHFGWSFLPNSVLIKGAHLRSPSGLLLHVIVLSLLAPSVLAVFLVTVFILWLTKREAWSVARVLMWILVLTLVQHLCMASVGWLFRYEAYLIALSVVAFANALPLPKVQRLHLFWLLVFVAIVALLIRATKAVVQGPEMSEAVYCQQYQMARFVRSYYPHGRVALNDFGLVSFTSGIHLLDMAGLADRAVGYAIQMHEFTPIMMQAEAASHDARIAAIYTAWYTPAVGYVAKSGLPDSWKCAGQWYSTDPRPLGRKVVTFYAVRSSEAVALSAHLRAYALQLPPQTLFFPCQ